MAKAIATSSPVACAGPRGATGRRPGFWVTATLALPLLLLPTSAFGGDIDRPLDLAERAAVLKVEELTALGLPGAIVGIESSAGEKRVFAIGSANLESGAPLRTGQTMRIGSVAKLVVATLVLQLADEGLLSLDNAVSDYVDGVPEGDRITLRMLGRHTSGLFNPIADPAFRKRLNSNPPGEISFSEIMEVVRDKAVSTEPERTFAYSNANTVLLARVVEEVTGAPLSAAIETRLRQIYGVETPYIPSNAELPDRELRGYRFGRDVDTVEYGEVFFDATAFSASWAGAAGNMNATLEDLLRLAEPLVSGASLSTDMRAILHDFAPRAPGFDYGFHLARFGRAIGHAGDVPGFSSFLAWLPDRDVSIVVLCNLSNLADKSAPATAIGLAIVEALERERASGDRH